MRLAVTGPWTSAVMPADYIGMRLLLSPVCVDTVTHRRTSMNRSCRRAVNEPQQSTSSSTRSSSSAPARSGWPPPPTPPSVAWTSSSWRPARTPVPTVGEWAHVRLFSPGPSSSTLPPDGCSSTPATGPHPDEDAYPTGGEWREAYLQPLADLLDGGAGRVRYGARVTGVAPRRAATCDRRLRPREPTRSPCTSTTAAGRGAAGRPRGHRRLRHLDHTEPARRRRLPRDRRTSPRRTDQLRHPRLPRPGRARPVRRQARRGRRQGRLGPGRADRSGQAGRGRTRPRGCRGCCAGPPSATRSAAATTTSSSSAARSGSRPRRRRPAGTVTNVTAFRTESVDRQRRRPPDADLGQRPAGRRRRRGHRGHRVPPRPRPSCPRSASTSTRRSSAARVLAEQIDPDHHSCGDVDAARLPGARPARAGPLPRRDEVLRPRARRSSR